MFSIPRVARLFLIVTALLAIPSLYLFYPGARPEALQKIGLDYGGIDSEHFRAQPPAPELAREREKTPEQAAVELEDEEQRALPDGANVGSGGQAPEHIGEGERVGSGGAGGPADHSVEHGAHRQASGGEETAVAFEHSAHAYAAATGGEEEFGKVIMPHLGNATAKAELGRGSWRLLHLMTLRYPDAPTPDDRAALKSFFHLFSRLYPCGECAEHFQGMLKEYPVQTGSRKSASLWLCNLHNIVNARLHKPEFDCLTLDSTYDCGCGNDTTSATGAAAAAENTAVIV